MNVWEVTGRQSVKELFGELYKRNMKKKGIYWQKLEDSEVMLCWWHEIASHEIERGFSDVKIGTL